MGLIVVLLASVVISLIAAFILLSIQFSIARVPISDIWRDREGRYRPVPKVYPSINAYKNRLRSENNLDGWNLAPQELIYILRNPDNENLIRTLPHNQRRDLIQKAKTHAKSLQNHSDDKIRDTAEQLLVTMENLIERLDAEDEKIRNRTEPSGIRNNKSEDEEKLLQAFQKMSEFAESLA